MTLDWDHAPLYLTILVFMIAHFLFTMPFLVEKPLAISDKPFFLLLEQEA